MADAFVYGTLRHLPLVERILGRRASDLNVNDAILPDHRVRCVQDEPFPAIEPALGDQAQGLLLQGVSDDDVAALTFYAAGFGHVAAIKDVKCSAGEHIAAQVFTPAPGVQILDAPWDLTIWVGRWGDIALRAAEEIMSYHGQLSVGEVTRSMGAINMRAAAWLAQQERAEDPDHPLREQVKVLSHTRPYMKFFAMEEIDFQHRRYDGSWSEVMNRGALMVGHAAVVLPYDPIRDEVLLVEQFRAATFIAGEKRPWMWEPVAGLIDPGETPEQAARREAVEEAGIELDQLESVGRTYSSSGSLGELVYMFVGVGCLDQTSQGGGMISEGEDIRRQILSYDRLMEGVDAGIYQDMPLVATALWLARHRDRIRAASQ